MILPITNVVCQRGSDNYRGMLNFACISLHYNTREDQKTSLVMKVINSHPLASDQYQDSEYPSLILDPWQPLAPDDEWLAKK